MTTPTENAQDTLEMMNGYVVIASQDITEVTNGGRVILAVRPECYSPSGFEYVTAVCDPRDQNPTTWSWGHYMHDMHDAVADFDHRANPWKAPQ